MLGSVYIGLYRAGAMRSVHEVNAPEYARQPFGTLAWVLFDKTAHITNANPILFPVPKVDWGQIIGVGLFTADRSGHLLQVAPITPVPASEGRMVVVPDHSIFMPVVTEQVVVSMTVFSELT